MKSIENFEKTDALSFHDLQNLSAIFSGLKEKDVLVFRVKHQDEFRYSRIRGKKGRRRGKSKDISLFMDFFRF